MGPMEVFVEDGQETPPTFVGPCRCCGRPGRLVIVSFVGHVASASDGNLEGIWGDLVALAQRLKRLEKAFAPPPLQGRTSEAYPWDPASLALIAGDEQAKALAGECEQTLRDAYHSDPELPLYRGDGRAFFEHLDDAALFRLSKQLDRLAHRLHELDPKYPAIDLALTRPNGVGWM
jgi:hypothetical protein